MNSEEMETKIKGCMKELVREYNNNPQSFITESDVTNWLYSILSRKLDSEAIAIHSELRPFLSKIQNGEAQNFVIKDRKEPRWDKQGKANNGAMIDLVVIDNDERFAKEARKKAVLEQRKDEIKKMTAKGSESVMDPLELRYWRMLSYPVKAFKTAIEAKIRVSGNLRKIRSDVKKLKRIKEEQNACALYLVVLDCRANETKFEEIRTWAKGNGVVAFTSRGKT